MPNDSATISENASAASMPSTVASLLTTALLERSELRSSRHFNQMSVPSWDMCCAWYFVLGTLCLVLGTLLVHCAPRSEEHTSELHQSQSNLVCRLLLEKKN